MINSDHNEIEKFNQLNQTDWWNPEGACSPLHAINPLRMSFIEKHLLNFENKKILDIGCGGGILCEALAKKGAHVTGIDLSPNALETANRHQETAEFSYKIDYCLMSAENFAEDHLEQFDVITCMEMLEHVPDPQSIILACKKILKPQGKIFLSTINRNLKSYLHAIIGAEWILNLLPKSTHDYAKFICPSELTQILRQQQFSLKDLQGISYKIFSKKYYLTSDISVNYLVYAEKI